MRTVKKLTALLLCLLMLIGMPFAVSAADTITLDAVVVQDITATHVTVSMCFSDKIALLNNAKIFLCNHAKQTGCNENYPDRWQFGSPTLTAIDPTVVDGTSYAQIYTAKFKRCTHTYHTENLWGTDGLALPTSAGIRITEYDVADLAEEGISTSVAVGMNDEVLATQETAYKSDAVVSHIAWMDATVSDAADEYAFSVSHVTKMPDWMVKAGDTEAVDRTLLVYFNTDPGSAPPDNFRFYMKINKIADATSGGSTFWAAKYNTNYVFPNNNPMAVTLMSEEEATAMAEAVANGTVTGVNGSGWTGYDGTLTEAMAGYGSEYGLRAVLCDSAYSSDTVQYLAGWYNAYGRALSITTNADGVRQRNNGYINISPVLEDALTLERAVYGDGQTLYAKFSDTINAEDFGTTFKVSMNITNADNDRMQTAVVDDYTSGLGTSGTYYEKTAIGMETIGDGWYKITFAEGDVDTVLGWKEKYWSGNPSRLARLCFREITQTKNFFVESITSPGGLPLAASRKTSQWETASLRADMATMDVETDIQARLELAEEGSTVSLTANEDAGELLVIPANVTLDLHGYELTVTNLNSYGDVKDSTEGTGGICLQGDTTLFTLQSGNSAVPLYDSTEECYRFYTYTFDHKTMDPPENAEKYALRLDLPSAAAYALLDDAANYDMLSVYLVLTDENGAEQETINYTFRQSTMEEYVTKSSVDIAEKYGLTLTVSGLDAVNAAGLSLSASARVAFSVGGVSVERAYVKGE